MGLSFFFFFFSHTPVLCSLSGPGAVRMSLGRPVGSWALVFSAAAGDRGGLPVPAPSEGGSAPGSGAGLPLWGWWCPGSRSIECIWGV